MNCAVTAHRPLAFLYCAPCTKKKHFHSSTTSCFSSFLSSVKKKVWAHQYMSPIVGDHHRLSSAEWRRWARPDATSFGFKRGAHQSGRAVVAQRSSLSQVNSNTEKICTCTNFKSTIIYVLFCSGCYLQYTKLYTVFYTCHQFMLVEHVFFTVITGAGLVCTTPHTQDTHKLWTFSCQPIPSYWIKQMRMGYEWRFHLDFE